MRNWTQLAADGNAMQRNIGKAIDKAMRQSAAATQTHYKSSFRTGGYVGDGSKWTRRKNTDQGRATLVQSGDLRRSIIARNIGQHIIVSSDKPYAEIHNEGGIIVQIPTMRQRMYFSHLSNNAFASGNTGLGNMFARMSRAKKLTIPIPERQFMAISGDRIDLNLKNKIYTIFKKNLDTTIPP